MLSNVSKCCQMFQKSCQCFQTFQNVLKCSIHFQMFPTNVVLLVLFYLCVLCRGMSCLPRVASTRLVNHFAWFFIHSVTVTQIVDEHCCADGRYISHFAWSFRHSVTVAQIVDEHCCADDRYTLGQPLRMVFQSFGDSDTMVDEHCCADG
jgi:hypothetical protein